ncbi:hypothetical protein GCM10019059_02840 [Camelimonas fluminis]|nr:hypothetical protein GCM10019059_02840 [Camelimonas fluminis]
MDCDHGASGQKPFTFEPFEAVSQELMWINAPFPRLPASIPPTGAPARPHGKQRLVPWRDRMRPFSGALLSQCVSGPAEILGQWETGVSPIALAHSPVAPVAPRRALS